MRIEEMTVSECRAMLSRSHLGRLACALNNQPYIVPIQIAFDGITLWGYSTFGQKIEWMRQNPLVCLEVDEIETDARWRSLIIFGSYDELQDTPEDDNARFEAERLFQKRATWWEPATVPLQGHEQRVRITFRIQLRRLTGRHAVPDAT